MKKSNAHVRWLITVVLILLAFVFVLPLLWMISSSLKPDPEVFATPFHWIPERIMWNNYAVVWTEKTASLPRAFLNTLTIILFGTGGQIFIASLAAYAFAKIHFRGKGFIFMMYLSAMMVPMQVTIIPKFMMFKTIGLYNSLWCIILPNLFSATTIFLLRQFYMGLPDSLVEAAKIDGASHPHIFFNVMLPLTTAAVVSSVVLSFISLWNEYLAPLIFLTNAKKYVLSQVVRWYLMEDAHHYNLTMAVATSCIVPVVIMVIFCQRYFVEGISTSGIKG